MEDELVIEIRIKLSENVKRFIADLLKGKIQEEEKSEDELVTEIHEEKKKLPLTRIDSVLYRVEEIISKSDIAPSTRNVYMWMAREFLKYTMKLEEIKIEHIEEFAKRFEPNSGNARSVAFLATALLMDKEIFNNAEKLLDLIERKKMKFVILGLYYFAKKYGIEYLVDHGYGYYVQEVRDLMKKLEEQKEKEAKETQEFFKDLAKKERSIMNGILK